jgi:hypothetical protein
VSEEGAGLLLEGDGVGTGVVLWCGWLRGRLVPLVGAGGRRCSPLAVPWADVPGAVGS